MAKVNTRGNRSSQSGHKITRRGLPKKTGGIGLNITGKAKRHWKSNMQKKKVRFSDGTVRTMWVRAADLRSGMYDNPDPKDFRNQKEYIMARELVRLVSTAGTGHFYVTKKNLKGAPEKLEMKKYDPKAREHVIYREAKMK